MSRVTARANMAAALIAAGCGVMLLALALPRFVSALILLPHDPTTAALARGERIAPAALADAATSRRQALALAWDGRVAAEHGILLLAHAHGLGYRSLAGARLSGESEQALRAALATAPAQPYAWTALAQAVLIGTGDGPPLNAPLAMALRTAPYEPRLVAPRLEIALRGWRGLDPALRAGFLDQIRHLARTSPADLARAARRHDGLAPVREALAADPALLSRFHIAYIAR